MNEVGSTNQQHPALRQFGRYVLLLLPCAAGAVYLRMCFPHLRFSWVYWPDWLQMSVKQQIFLVVFMPIVEAYYCGWGYLVAAGSFFVVTRFSTSHATGPMR